MDSYQIENPHVASVKDGNSGTDTGGWNKFELIFVKE